MGCDRFSDDPVQCIVEATVKEQERLMLPYIERLLREFGADLCNQWHDHYAGKYVPKRTRDANALRSNRIRELARAGTPLDQLARDFHLTPGAVRRIVKTSNEPEPDRSA